MVFSNNAIAVVLGDSQPNYPSPVKRGDSEGRASCKPVSQSFKTVERAIPIETRAPNLSVYQSHPKASISRPLRVSEDQRNRIVDRYNNAGDSIRKISREEGRARQTVARIVRAADTSEYDSEIERMRQEFRSFVPLAFKSLIRAMENDKTGIVAARYMENAGIVPKRKRR